MAKKASAFQKALTDAALSRYDETLKQDEAPVQFSEQHLSEIEKLTKKTQRKSWKYVNTTAKRVLIAAILLFLLATVCAAVPAIREGLLRFFLHDNGTAFTFEFSQEELDRAPKEIEQYYVPSYIPPEFTFESEDFGPTSVWQNYRRNDHITSLGYSQMVLWDTTPEDYEEEGAVKQMGISSTNTTVKTEILQGYEVRLIYMKLDNYPDDMVILWTDHEYLYMISSSYLELSEVDKIIASMTPVDPR